jgi:3-oxoacyl-[acyl-carrier protein] reductase
MSGDSTEPRIAVVTGVSRKAGIGFAIARRLLADGLSVLIHSWSAHDEAQPWGSEPGGMDAVIAGLGGLGPQLAHVEADFANALAPSRVMTEAIGAFGAVDVLVANHAHGRTALRDQQGRRASDDAIASQCGRAPRDHGQRRQSRTSRHRLGVA